MTIEENISEKKRRGRPRGPARERRDAMPGSLPPEGCLRTQTDWCYGLSVFGGICDADEDTQRAAWGCTAADIGSGAARFPKGFRTAAVEGGRYIATCNVAPVSVARVIADARQRGFSWSEIAAHFRRERLGDREGSADALFAVLHRALTDFRRRFPAISNQRVHEAVMQLVDTVNKEEGHDEN